MCSLIAGQLRRVTAQLKKTHLRLLCLLLLLPGLLCRAERLVERRRGEAGLSHGFKTKASVVTCSQK